MTIKNFTKANLPGLREDINKALEAVAQKHGISIAAGRATFSDKDVTFKLEAIVNGTDGSTRSKMEMDLENRFPQLVGKKIQMNAGLGTVIGYKARNTKYPFIVKVGKTNYKVPRSMVM